MENKAFWDIKRMLAATVKQIRTSEIVLKKEVVTLYSLHLYSEFKYKANKAQMQET